MYIDENGVVALLSGARNAEAVSSFAKGSWPYIVLASQRLVIVTSLGYIMWITNRLVWLLELFRKSEIEKSDGWRSRRVIHKAIVCFVTFSALILTLWIYAVFGLICFADSL